MGIDNDKNGIGEPVASHTKPTVGKIFPVDSPQTTDEFNSPSFGLQWQWEGNWKDGWISLDARKGWLRLFPQRPSSKYRNLWNVPSLMLQKFPAPAFSATVKLDCSSMSPAEKTGLLVFGLDYSYASVKKTATGYTVEQAICAKADKGTQEEIVASADLAGPDLYLRLEVKPENEADIIPKVLCSFSYSVDGMSFHSVGKIFTAREGLWVGAKMGLCSMATDDNAKLGHTDIDWFRVDRLKQ
jgi:hypothetical protein